ncbi:MAG: cupin domain-containing protein [bacterium]
MLARVDIKKVQKGLKEPWMPVDVARVNNFAVRCVKIKGEYHWHTHRNEDEFFLVQDGKMVIQTTEGDVSLGTGQGVVVPKGMRHCSKSDRGAVVLVFERQTTRKEGD